MLRRWTLKHLDFAKAGATRKSFRHLLSTESCTADIATPELVFGELMTNALRYGIEPMSVAVDVRDGMMTIEVEDAGRCFDLAGKLKARPTTSGGRGLRIVRTLTSSLKVEETATRGCRVIATLPL